MRATAALCTCLALIAALGNRPQAWAADDDGAALLRARARFVDGEKLYALGRFEEALPEYEAAYNAAPLPEFLFNIGQCHRNLGHHTEAIFAFKKFLREKPTADNQAAVQALIAELESEREGLAASRRSVFQPPLIPPVEPKEPPRPTSHRSYSRWWLLAGLVVVAGAAATFALWPAEPGPPSSSLGNLDFPK